MCSPSGPPSRDLVDSPFQQDVVEVFSDDRSGGGRHRTHRRPQGQAPGQGARRHRVRHQGREGHRRPGDRGGSWAGRRVLGERKGAQDGNELTRKRHRERRSTWLRRQLTGTPKAGPSASRRYSEHADLTPYFKGLPDDRCQAIHLGYVLKGKLIFHYTTGRPMSLRLASAYVTQPGHTPELFPDTEVVEFTRADELAQTMAVVEKNMELRRRRDEALSRSARPTPGRGGRPPLPSFRKFLCDHHIPSSCARRSAALLRCLTMHASCPPRHVLHAS